MEWKNQLDAQDKRFLYSKSISANMYASGCIVDADLIYFAFSCSFYKCNTF